MNQQQQYRQQQMVAFLQKHAPDLLHSYLEGFMCLGRALLYSQFRIVTGKMTIEQIEEQLRTVLNNPNIKITATAKKKCSKRSRD